MKTFDLVFHPASEKPAKPASISDNRDFLLYNQCDGFHVVVGRWFDDGEFYEFCEFMGASWEEGSYCAWAKLPDGNKDLFDTFAKKAAL